MSADSHQHLIALETQLKALERHVSRIDVWGALLAERLSAGARLLTAGNGGSAAQAQHLAAELVGRFCRERPALSAIALNENPSALTAIGNDYGPEPVFARQVAAHGRPGDVLLCLSTSGRSPNLLAAGEVAHERNLVVWALTGPSPNRLAQACDEAIGVEAAHSSTVQEVHLVVLHLLCDAVERCVAAAPATAPPGYSRSLVGRLAGSPQLADSARE